MRPLLDAVLLDIGGTLVVAPGSDVGAPELRVDVVDDVRWLTDTVRLGGVTDGSTLRDDDIRRALGPSGVAPLLEVVVTATDAGASVPDPALLRAAVERLGIDDPQRVLFVGDDDADRDAAAAAGLPFADVRGNGSGPLSLRGAVQRWLDSQAGHRFENARAAVGQADLEAANAAAAVFGKRQAGQPGGLGRLEQLAIQLAGIAGVCPAPVPGRPTLAVFAGDHGILNWNVSPWPQELTAWTVTELVAGNAPVNALARRTGAEVLVVDVGVAAPIELDDPSFRQRKIRRGTANLGEGPAMSRTEALLALDVGAEIAEQAVADGADCLIAGATGVGNTTAATAIISVVTDTPAQDITRGSSGADDEMLRRKVQVIDAATENLSPATGAMTLLEQVGGFEIAAMAGYIVGGAAARVPVVLDGTVADAALLVAAALAPDVVDFVIAGHSAGEPAADAALAFLGTEAVLDLGMCIGEGTGAVVAVPVIQAAAAVLAQLAQAPAGG